jgi:hypothetical protein
MKTTLLAISIIVSCIIYLSVVAGEMVKRIIGG